MRSCASLSQISHGARPGYFSGARGQVDVGADALGHLADRRRQAAGAAVGDRRVQARRRRRSTSISSFSMIGSPICTLAPATSPVVGVHRRAGERRAADAVAPGASAEHDDPVAGMRAGASAAGVGGDADAAAEHQRVGGVAGVVQHGAGDGRQPDLVAVVGDAGDDAGARCAAGCSTPSGSSSSGEIGGPEAEDVGDGDRAVGRAEHVADHAADAGVGAAERLDRGRVVVRLGLEGQRRARGELDDAGVADERADDERRGDRGRSRRAAGFISGVDRASPSSAR